MNKIKMLTSSSLLIAIVLLLAINILSNTTLHSARVDLTENNVFTLSPGTRNILQGLDEPVTLRFYLSQKLATRLPGITGYATRVKELLEEYKRAAGSNLNLSIIEPEPFSEAEDEAVGFGLQGVALNDGENTFYFGLVATGATDEQAVIPFFSPERQEFVEYDITKIVQQTAYPKKKVVGLISTLNITGSASQHVPGMPPRPANPWVVVDQIKQSFELRKLDNDVDKIPEEIEVLMLVHPKDLSDDTLYAIDQFVLRGGRTLVFLDPHAETDPLTADTSGMPGTNFGSSDLGKVLASWGLKMDKSKIVGDVQLAQKVGFNVAGRTTTVNFPIWMRLPEEQLNQDDIITSKLGIINVASPGNLEILKTEGISITPLVQTTDKSALIDKTRLRFLADPNDILRGFTPTNETYTVAVRVNGTIKTAFADKAGQEAHLAESKESVNLIVVSDTDMLDDRFWVRIQNLFGSRIAVPAAANGSFVVNALDNLMGSNDLISVRNRGHFAKPFTRVDEIRQEAESQYREKEQQLMTRLRETERKLLDLQNNKKDNNAVLLSEQQRNELAKFRQEKVKIRKELRQVRHQLRKDIENLEGWLKFLNIGLLPILIGIGGIVVAVLAVKKREAGTTGSPNETQSNAA